MNNLSLIGKKAHVTTTADNRQRRVPFIEPMISPKKRKNTTSSRVKRNKQNDAAVKQLLFENRQSQSNDRINYRMENNNNQNNLPINSPNATAWLRSQGLLFQTDFFSLKLTQFVFKKSLIVFYQKKLLFSIYNVKNSKLRQ